VFALRFGAELNLEALHGALVETDHAGAGGIEVGDHGRTVKLRRTAIQEAGLFAATVPTFPKGQ
jgi:hypothetical protein